jgi:hypothetical protein
MVITQNISVPNASCTYSDRKTQQLLLKTSKGVGEPSLETHAT